jgi:hypothetical protein
MKKIDIHTGRETEDDHRYKRSIPSDQVNQYVMEQIDFSMPDTFNPSPLSSKSSKTTATAITTTPEDFEDSGDGAPVLHFNQ